MAKAGSQCQPRVGGKCHRAADASASAVPGMVGSRERFFNSVITCAQRKFLQPLAETAHGVIQTPMRSIKLIKRFGATELSIQVLVAIHRCPPAKYIRQAQQITLDSSADVGPESVVIRLDICRIQRERWSMNRFITRGRGTARNRQNVISNFGQREPHLQRLESELDSVGRLVLFLFDVHIKYSDFTGLIEEMLLQRITFKGIFNGFQDLQ